MSDVFISYARSTAAQAEQVTDALRGLGYEVWRDEQLPAHLAYGEAIEERLNEAKAVVVIWSADALQSVWVRSEADRARVLRKLVQISIDGCRLPMPFDQIQCADLAGWTGETDNRGFRKVLESVAHLVADRAPPVTTCGTPSADVAQISVPKPTPVEASTEAPVDPTPTAARPALAEPPSAPSDDAPRFPEPAVLDLTPAAREEPTPVVATQPSLAEPPTEAAKAAIAAPESIAVAPLGEDDDEATESAPAAVPMGRRAPPRAAIIGMAAAAAVVLVAGVVWLGAGSAAHHPVGQPAVQAASARPILALALSPTPSAAPAAIPFDRISQAAAAVARDASSQGRPGSETAGLTQMQSRIETLLTQLKSASARADASSVAALTTQLNQTAAQGAKVEATTLSRAGATMAGEVRNTLRGESVDGASTAVAALHDSTRKLEAVAAGAGAASDAAGSLDALHATFGAWSHVRTDYATATALYPLVLRARFQTEAGAARAVAARVTAAAAKAPKPWLFSSTNQRHAYAALQANAATAKADLTQLDALGRSVADSRSESELRAAIRQAGELRASLEPLAAAPAPPKTGG